MTVDFKFAQLQTFSLAGAGAIPADTTITLKSMLGIDGAPITMTEAFGVIGFGTLEPGSGVNEEQISFTGLVNNPNGTTTLTGVSSVTFLAPYTQTSGLLKTHAGSTSFIISNTSGFYDELEKNAQGGYVTIENTGTPVTQRRIINLSNLLTATDDTPNTDLTINVVNLANDTDFINTLTENALFQSQVNSFVSGGGSGGTKLVIDTTDVSVPSGTTTTVYTENIPGGTLGTNNAIRFTLVNLSASQATITVKYGGTTIASVSAPIINTGRTGFGGIIVANAATNSQKGFIAVIANSSGSETEVNDNAVGLSTVDSTIDQNLEIVITAAGGFTSTAGGIIIEKITNSGSDVQTFTSSGTWTKPAGAKAVYVIAVGAGGGGAGGSLSVGLAGGAGAGGAFNEKFFDASIVGSTETVTVGAAGTGGLGSIGATPGTNGTAGGTSSFGSKLLANGGGAGLLAGTASTGGQNGGLENYGGNGGAKELPGSNSLSGAGGGGGGDGSHNTGGAGGGAGTQTGTGGGGAGGIFASTTPPVDGDDYTTLGTAYTGAGGGGGYGGNDGITDGTSPGANGGLYGGGGGGGGGGVNTGGANSSNGGNGAQGVVVVITNF